MPWSLFFAGVSERAIKVALGLACGGHWLHVFLGSPSLSREGEFAGRVALLQSGDLAVLHGELIDDVGELRGPELETLYRNQLQRRSARKGQRESGSGLIEHLKFNFGRSYVPTRESFEQCRVQGIRLARKDDFGLIE